MTSVFSADGKNVPCTVIEAGPCVVTQVKTVEKDGYEAVQLAFGVTQSQLSCLLTPNMSTLSAPQRVKVFRV